MSAYIHHIATAVPENYYNQNFIRDFMKHHVAKDRMTSMILHRIYTQSGIEKRHSVLKDFHGWQNPVEAESKTSASDVATAGDNSSRNSISTETSNTAKTSTSEMASGSKNTDVTAKSASAEHSYKAAIAENSISSDVERSPKSPAEPTNHSKNLFLDEATGTLVSPSTGARNNLYMHEARKLFISAAQNIFAERPDLNKSDITHVVTVSCTGFYAPGPDLDVVNALGLSGSTQRYHLGFMGCYAALPALRLANSLVASTPGAVVLIVAAELCTLHLKFESDTDSLLSTTVFADGCAAALVSGNHPETDQKSNLESHSSSTTFQTESTGQNHNEVSDRISKSLNDGNSGKPTNFDQSSEFSNKRPSDHKPNGSSIKPDPTSHPALRIDGLFSALTPNGAEDMAWTIGDNGFDMVLSSYIPDIIESNLDGVLSPIWAQSGRKPQDIDLWAVHPGGRAIVDKVQANLGLEDHQVASSRRVLRDYGNMSSATILFVLRDLMQTSARPVVEKQLQAADMATGNGHSSSEALTNHETESNSHPNGADAFIDNTLERAETVANGENQENEHQSDEGKSMLAMAFGPGLTVETGLFTLIG